MKKTRKRIMSIFTIIPMLGSMLSVLPPMQVFAASNEQMIYDFLVDKVGFNCAAACGVLANIEKESGFDPHNSYMEADGYISYGICQWNKDRYNNLKSFCSKNGYDYTSLTGQLYYLKSELETSYYKKWVTNTLRSVENTADGAKQAGYTWCYYFEVPAGYNTGTSDKRGDIARDKYWPKYHPNYKLYMRYHANGGSLRSESTYFFKNNDGIMWDSEDGSQWGNVWTIETRSEYGLINAGTFKLYRDGYYFKGWCLKSDGSGTIYDPDDTSVIAETFFPDIKYRDGEVTFYAIWEPYTVTFHYNANRGVLASDSEYYLDNGLNILRKSDNSADMNVWTIESRSDYGLYNASSFKLSRPGHQFLGWSTRGIDKIFDQDDSSVIAETFFPDIKTKSGTVLFYAQWKENMLTLHYNLNGGQVADDSIDYYAKDGLVYRKDDNTPVTEKWTYDKDNNFYNCTTLNIMRPNYKFIGWSTQPTSGTILGEDQVLKPQEICTALENGNQEITVYAQWEPVKPTVKLYENKSGINYLLDSELSSIKGQEMKYGEVGTYTVDPTNTYNGDNIISVKVFQDDEKMGTRQFSVSSSLAKSAPYTGEVSSSDKYYISFYAKASVKDSKIGARFGYGGWNQTYDLTTEWKWYSIEVSSSNTTDQNIHFHFNKAGTYSLSHMMLTDNPVTETAYIAEFETKPTITLEKNETGSFDTLPTLERVGYEFDGWFTKRVAGEQVINPDTESSQILYAHWKEKPLELSMENGEKQSVTEYVPNAVDFVSSNSQIAVVSKSGMVTAIGEGECVITIVMANGSTSQVKLTVMTHIESVDGDLNGDNIVTVSDAILLARIIAEDITVSVSKDGMKNADMNHSGAPDSDDLTLLLKQIAGITG